MGTFVDVSIRFRTMECCNCGMSFAMTESFYDRKKKDHEGFYCPEGHGQNFTGKTTEQKLKEQLQREKLERQGAEDRAEKSWQRAEKAIREKRAFKGHLTRTKNRIAAGLCPCCKRNFENLGNHMKSQHPDYAEAQ